MQLQLFSPGEIIVIQDDKEQKSEWPWVSTQ